jgi:hypothetical protein
MNWLATTANERRRRAVAPPMRVCGLGLASYPGRFWTHQRRRRVAFFAAFLALLFLPTAFPPADDLAFLAGRLVIVRLTFLAVFFALVVNSAIMCSSSDFSLHPPLRPSYQRVTLFDSPSFTRRRFGGNHGSHPAITRPQKITFGEMRSTGLRNVLV